MLCFLSNSLWGFVCFCGMEKCVKTCGFRVAFAHSMGLLLTMGFISYSW